MNKPSIFGIELDYREPYQYLLVWGIVTLGLLILAAAVSPGLALGLSIGILLAVSLLYVM